MYSYPTQIKVKLFNATDCRYCPPQPTEFTFGTMMATISGET